MDEYGDALARIDELIDIGDVAICLNRSFFDGEPDKEITGFEENMVLYTKDEKYEIDRKEQIYPKEWAEKNKVFIFGSLRSSIQTYGYVVMPYRSDFFSKLKHRTIVESIALSLHTVNLRIELDRIK